MKKFTVYLPDWLAKRLETLMKQHGMINYSDVVRTLLIFSVREFENFLQEAGIEKDTTEEEEPDVKGIRLLMRIIDETRRLEEAQGLQNKSIPGFPADWEPTTNRMGEARTDWGRFLSRSIKPTGGN